MDTQSLIKSLKAGSQDALTEIKSQTPDYSKIQEYIKEYKNRDRNLRDSQIGNTQKDKIIDGKQIPAVRIPVNFAKKIVTTSAAFEVGKPATLTPSDPNDLYKVVMAVWKVNRMDALIQKLLILKKSQTQGAIQFYIKTVESKSTSFLGKALVKAGLKKGVKEIKAKVLDNDKGRMTPYFNDQGNMILFMWEYQAKLDGKNINFIQVWDEKNCYYFDDSKEKMDLVKTLPHGFDRIPIVYVNQEYPEWFDVQEMIDRYETSLSKLGNSNDYAAYPILKTYGKVINLPGRDENGKVINFPIEVDDEGNEHHGDAEFLVADNATDSTKLELESLEKLIHYISHTPNISFDNIKGISSLSGIALKLMFLDAMIKASMNEGDNRTMIERMLNIIMSGIVNTTNTPLKSQVDNLYFEVEFNNILPDDLKEAVDIVSSAVSSGVMSKRTAVEYLGMNSDIEQELKLINEEKTPDHDKTNN